MPENEASVEPTQIFGYTPGTPEDGTSVGYIQVFKTETAFEFVVRDHRTPPAAQTLAACPIDTTGLLELERAIAGEVELEVEFTQHEIELTPILKFFAYAHLPPHLRVRSRVFAEVAREIIDTLPASAERTAGLRKLLESKDCIVRAALP